MVGLLPGYAAIGLAAPVILIVLRLLQGLALGGEYGGAAIYVAEHAPHGKRGLFTSWVQTTSTLAALAAGGPRLPTMDRRQELYRLGLAHPIPAVDHPARNLDVYPAAPQQIPLFQRMKAEGRGSRAPLTESFAERGNLKIVLIALFGATAGQGVVWYCGQFYALFFLTQTLKINSRRRS